MVVIFLFLRRKPPYERRISDWSSDVCSSDLMPSSPGCEITEPAEPAPRPHVAQPGDDGIAVAAEAKAEIGRTVGGHMSPPLKPVSRKGKHGCGEVHFSPLPQAGGVGGGPVSSAVRRHALP